MTDRLTLLALDAIDWLALWGGRLGLAMCAAFYLFGLWDMGCRLLAHWGCL